MSGFWKTILSQQKELDEAHQRGYEEGAKAERERIFFALSDACISRSWVDTDGDAHYGALTLDEIKDVFRATPGRQEPE